MRYDAFLSYSHAGDSELAASLQSALQRFARPWYRTYALRVFRDKTGLAANPALWNSIVSALKNSEYLLLLASPHAAASPWVNQEVDWFVRNREPDKVLIVITGGQLAWSAAAGDFDWDHTTALPPSLRGAFRLEPLYVDLSWAHEAQFLQDARYRDAILDLAAPLHGRAKDDLDSEDLRQHRRTLEMAWSAVVLLSILAVALSIAALYALRQRDVARRQTAVATEQTAVAKEQKGRAEEQARIADEQRQLAETRRTTALSRQLAAQAGGDTATGLDAAMLEAVEAYRTAPTFEARKALLTVLLYSPHLRRFLRGQRHTWRSGSLSRDGRTMAAIDEDSRRVYLETAGAQSLEPAGVLDASPKVASVALSGDGTLVATGEPGKVVVRNTRTRTIEGSLNDGLGSGAPAVVAFSADRALVAGYESAPGVLIWDRGSGRLRVPALRPKRSENAMAFSPDGSVLATGARDGSIVLWATDTGKPIGAPLTGHRAQIFGLAFSPDGRILASGSEDRTVILWDVKTGTAIGRPLTGHGTWPVGYSSWGLSVAFSPDGGTLASAAKDGTVILWDVAGRRAAGAPLRGHSAPPMAIAFSADGSSLISLGSDNVALRWATDPVSALAKSMGNQSEGYSMVAFRPDGKALASPTAENAILLADPATGRPLGAPLEGQQNLTLALAFGAGGQTLRSAAKDRLVDWDLKRGTNKSTALAGTDEAVSQAAFSPDGNTMAWSDGYSLLLRIGSGPAAHLPVARASPSHMVYGLAFSPDGHTLASGGFDGTLALWDVSARQLRWPAVHAHRMAVQTLAFSPDGKVLATGAIAPADSDDTVRLWDTQSGRELGPALSGHSGPVRAIAFSPDGTILACAASGTIIFWDLERRQRLGEAVADADGFVTSLLFSPDGQRLASGRFQDTTLVWDLRLEEWQRRACAAANRSLSEKEWSRLVGETPAFRNSCR